MTTSISGAGVSSERRISDISSDRALILALTTGFTDSAGKSLTSAVRSYTVAHRATQAVRIVLGYNLLHRKTTYINHIQWPQACGDSYEILIKLPNTIFLDSPIVLTEIDLNYLLLFALELILPKAFVALSWQHKQFSLTRYQVDLC